MGKTEKMKCFYVQKHNPTQRSSNNRSILFSVILKTFYNALICMSSTWLSAPCPTVPEESVSSRVCPMSSIKLHLSHVVFTFLEIRGGAENEWDPFPFVILQMKCLINSFGASFNTWVRHIAKIKPLKFQTSRLISCLADKSTSFLLEDVANLMWNHWNEILKKCH